METSPQEKKKKKNDTANDRSNPRPLPTVTHLHLAPRFPWHCIQPQLNPPLSWPLGMTLRYDSIWGMNREGKNAIPDYANHRNGQIGCRRYVAWIAAHLWLKHMKKSLNYIYSLKHSNRHQYSSNLEKTCSGRKLVPHKWQQHSRWHGRGRLRCALLRQQPLLRVPVTAAASKKKRFFFKNKEIQSIYCLEKQTQASRGQKKKKNLSLSLKWVCKRNKSVEVWEGKHSFKKCVGFLLLLLLNFHFS